MKPGWLQLAGSPLCQDGLPPYLPFVRIFHNDSDLPDLLASGYVRKQIK